MEIFCNVKVLVLHNCLKMKMLLKTLALYLKAKH